MLSFLQTSLIDSQHSTIDEESQGTSTESDQSHLLSVQSSIIKEEVHDEESYVNHAIHENADEPDVISVVKLSNDVHISHNCGPINEDDDDSLICDYAENSSLTLSEGQIHGSGEQNAIGIVVFSFLKFWD